MSYGQNNTERINFYLAHDMCNLPIGTRLLTNPPHITQCPPAEVESSRLPEVEQFLAALVGETEPIALRSMGQALFGRRSDPTLVTQFDKPRALDAFHTKLIHGLAKSGCDFIGLEYALKGYNPHTEAILLDPDVVVTMDNLTFYTERQTPRLHGLDEITARYAFGSA